MRTEEYDDGAVERRITVGLITDDALLGAVAARWEPRLLPSDYAQLVGGWCVDYFRRHGRAPGRDVEGLFERWAADRPDDKSTVRTVRQFLEALSGEYKRLRTESNTDFLLDLAGGFLNKARVRNLIRELEGDVSAGDVARAQRRVNEFQPVRVGGQGDAIDVLQDEAAWTDAYDDKAVERLVVYPGAAGEFFGEVFARDKLVSFVAPEKRGKSWWLQDVAFRAVFQRRRTAFFAVGDMTRRQMLRRFGSRLARSPARPKSYQYPVIMGPKGEVTLEERTPLWPHGVTYQAAWEAARAAAMKKVRSNNSYFKLAVYPTSSVTVAGIEDVLNTWARGGWTVDCVVIDYADILAPMNGTADTRDQINMTWMKLRALSQKLHCLVVTATQADAKSYDGKLITMNNFSEDKRKNAHVDALVGINQDAVERENGVYRLNFPVGREVEYGPTTCVYTAGCLAVANPCVLSGW